MMITDWGINKQSTEESHFSIYEFNVLTHLPFFFRAVFLFVLAFIGVLYPYNRGALYTSLVVTHTLTSVVAGYTSSSIYNQFVETGWVITVL